MWFEVHLLICFQIQLTLHSKWIFTLETWILALIVVKNPPPCPQFCLKMMGKQSNQRAQKPSEKPWESEIMQKPIFEICQKMHLRKWTSEVSKKFVKVQWPVTSHNFIRRKNTYEITRTCNCTGKQTKKQICCHMVNKQNFFALFAVFF